MRVGGTRVGLRGRWVSGAPTEVRRQESDGAEKGGGGDLGIRLNTFGNRSTLTCKDKS